MNGNREPYIKYSLIVLLNLQMVAPAQIYPNIVVEHGKVYKTIWITFKVWDLMLYGSHQ